MKKKLDKRTIVIAALMLASALGVMSHKTEKAVKEKAETKKEQFKPTKETNEFAAMLLDSIDNRTKSFMFADTKRQMEEVYKMDPALFDKKIESLARDSVMYAQELIEAVPELFAGKTITFEEAKRMLLTNETSAAQNVNELSDGLYRASSKLGLLRPAQVKHRAK